MHTDNGSASDSVNTLARILAERRLATPALLFLAAHRPLAFLTGQALHGLQPLAELLNVDVCGEVAAVLSAPNAAHRLEVALTKAERENGDL